MCQSEIPVLRRVRVQHMPFEFFAEMTDGSSNRPGSRIAQRADGVALDLALDVPKQVDIGFLSFAIFYVVQDLFHPTRAFAAGRALAAALMAIEPREP